MQPMTGSIDEATTVFDKILQSAESQYPNFHFTRSDMFQHAPYTTVVVQFYDRMGVGYAKCAPNDKFDRVQGVKLATRRALTSFFSNPTAVFSV